MTHLLIRHKVADFIKWKAAYDKHSGVRESAGLAQVHLFQTIDEPNEVVMLFSVADLGQAKALVASDEMRTAMQNAGVIDKPNIYFLK